MCWSCCAKEAHGTDIDVLRDGLRMLVQEVMVAEVTSKTGAGLGQRSPERLIHRNGYGDRPWDTRVGTLDLRIPKVREGSYFPSLLEPRRRSERALLAVVQQAYVEGVSTRRVEDLVQALGCEGISKSQVSRICQELDGVVDSFLGRPLDRGPYPYLWLDALTVNVSVVAATGVNREGKREVLGIDVGTSKDGAFWLAFLRSLMVRGLSGVQLVTSDAHQGLKDAIATVFAGGSWERRSGRTTPRSASTRRYGDAPTSWASSRTGLRSVGSSGQSSPSSTTNGRSPAAICPLLPSTSAISTAWRHQ